MCLCIWTYMQTKGVFPTQNYCSFYFNIFFVFICFWFIFSSFSFNVLEKFTKIDVFTIFIFFFCDCQLLCFWLGNCCSCMFYWTFFLCWEYFWESSFSIILKNIYAFSCVYNVWIRVKKILFFGLITAILYLWGSLLMVDDFLKICWSLTQAVSLN